jgi:hypothetical protein
MTLRWDQQEEDQQIGLEFEEETSKMLHLEKWLRMVLKLGRFGQQIRNI